MKKAGVVLLAAFPFVASAQDKVETSVNADLVSGYIWRGQDLGGISVQPSFSLGYKGVYFTAWGSVGFDSEDAKEIDLTLGYELNGFSVSVTDYWTEGEAGFFHYGARNTGHVFEAQLGYDFGWLATNWYTNFAGADGITSSGKRAYSSYLELSAPFNLGGLEWEVRAGAVPWTTDFYNDGTGGFEVTEVGIAVFKEIPITKQYALPLSASLTWNPATEGAYFVFGIHF